MKRGTTTMGTTTNGNCLLFHGGGLCPLSNWYLSLLAEALEDKKFFKQILMGFFSFECLLNPKEFIKPWNASLHEDAKVAPGGFFGTSRGIDLTDPKMQKQAIETCKALSITSIGVAGGDGSCRQIAEISEAFKAEGIQLFIPMILTIDGIEGGHSLGILPAVKEAFEFLDNLAATNLQTRDNREFSVLFLETQGRNRDDILAFLLGKIESVKKLGGIPLSDIDLYSIPANYHWNKDKLIEAIKDSKKRTVVIYSEGSDFPLKEVEEAIGRKVRASKVGYLSQMNKRIELTDYQQIRDYFVRMAVEAIISNYPKSFPLTFDKHSFLMNVEKIDYWAKLNPRKCQNPTLDSYYEDLLKKYTP